MHGSPARYLAIAAFGVGAALALSGPAAAAEWDTMLRGTNSTYTAPQQAKPQDQRQAAQPAATTVAKQANPSGSPSSAGDANRLQR